MLIPTIIFETVPLDYDFFTGPVWFLLILLLFNVFYAFSPGALPSMRLPSLVMLMVFVGVPLGVLVNVYGYSGYPFGLPGGLGDIFPYVTFFVGGLIAGKNRWMDDIKNISGATTHPPAYLPTHPLFFPVPNPLPLLCCITNPTRIPLESKT